MQSSSHEKGRKTSIPYRDQITRVSLWFTNQGRITKAKGYLVEFTTRVVLRKRLYSGALQSATLIITHILGWASYSYADVATQSLSVTPLLEHHHHGHPHTCFPQNEENSPNGQTQSFVYDGATKWACCIALRSPSAT
jgi:hypothetical protein